MDLALARAGFMVAWLLMVIGLTQSLYLFAIFPAGRRISGIVATFNSIVFVWYTYAILVGVK